jgi:hypothetical protein
MGLAPIGQARARVVSVEELGLDATSFSIDSPEVLAAALRRGASFLCPTTATPLTNAVVRSLEWVVADGTQLSIALSGMLDALIGCGDLLELTNATEGRTSGAELFIGPPAYVRRQSGSYLVLGIRPEGQPLIGEAAQAMIRCDRHLRIIEPTPGTDIEALLVDYELRDVSLTQWLRCPRPVQPHQLVEELDRRLMGSGATGVVEGMTILDPGKSVTYYKGRWRPPTSRDIGRFVARRPRAYGAPIWCYAELEGGAVSRLIDLPLDGGLRRGCDEAWRLQAAIDSVRGNPQRIRVRSSAESDRAIMDLFSPPPGWFQRRWDALGSPLVPERALLSYSLPRNEVPEELRFAFELMWMTAEEC